MRMCDLLGKIRALTQAAPFRAYVPITEFTLEEQSTLSDARADIVSRDGRLCYCVWNAHMCVRSYMATREMLATIYEESANREKQQLESFALDG